MSKSSRARSNVSSTRAAAEVGLEHIPRAHVLRSGMMSLTFISLTMIVMRSLSNARVITPNFPKAALFLS